MTLGTVLLWMVVLMYGVPAGVAGYEYPDVAWMIVGPIVWWTFLFVIVAGVCLWVRAAEARLERSS